MAFIKDVLREAVGQWNHAVESVKDFLEKPQTILQHVEANATDVHNQQEIQSITSDLANLKNSRRLRKIVLSEKDAAFEILALVFSYLCFKFYIGPGQRFSFVGQSLSIFKGLTIRRILLEVARKANRYQSWTGIINKLQAWEAFTV